MKVLMLDSTHAILEDGLHEMGFTVVSDYTSSKEKILQTIQEYDGLIIRSRFKLDADFIARASHLKFIGRFGAGLENIDLDAAQAANITCLRVPEGNRNAVAEHALGMLLALFNNLPRAQHEVRSGIWKRAENTGNELAGKTVAVIGYGYMGSAFVGRLQHMDVHVLIYDKYKTDYAPDFATETDLETIFNEADVVSLHVPLTEETNHMVDAVFLHQFAKPIYLINTARGPVVKTHDLADALKNGSVLGACLDVLEQEKISFENLFEGKTISESLQYLLAHDRVIITPHIAGWSKQSFAKMAQVMLEKIAQTVSR